MLRLSHNENAWQRKPSGMSVVVASKFPRQCSAYSGQIQRRLHHICFDRQLPSVAVADTCGWWSVAQTGSTGGQVCSCHGSGKQIQRHLHIFCFDRPLPSVAAVAVADICGGQLRRQAAQEDRQVVAGSGRQGVKCSQLKRSCRQGNAGRQAGRQVQTEEVADGKLQAEEGRQRKAGRKLQAQGKRRQEVAGRVMQAGRQAIPGRGRAGRIAVTGRGRRAGGHTIGGSGRQVIAGRRR
ncbi:hypothetical protein CBR_g24392 [Chara braunii]|uniref:Uncharacterized protein n=1 Tax=Chara braunii TaxID=69332 RepID=A0A388JMK4_CHABU|nr:hypothetical protein CBR_g24392 [Chara braunii]|eukprot:GBG59046.1 hypothetical protein CBR_g24392 [Chara braunii]